MDNIEHINAKLEEFSDNNCNSHYCHVKDNGKIQIEGDFTIAEIESYFAILREGRWTNEIISHDELLEASKIVAQLVNDLTVQQSRDSK
jgi:hypothetical protein